MKVDVKDCEGLKKEITFEIPADIITKKMENAYNELKKTVNLRGFRKGKIPRPLLKVHFSKTVEKDVLEEVIPEYYEMALKEAELSPIGQPQFAEDPQITEGDPLSIKMNVEVKPKVEVKDYKGIELTRKPVVVNDEDIDKELAQLREENALFVVVNDRPVREGDGVIVDYDYCYDEQHVNKEGVFIDLTKDHSLEEKLVGMNNGEKRQFDIILPDDYQVKELRGKKVTYEVALKEIKEKNLPELDDEFAKDIGDYDNLNALREKLIDKLKQDGEAAEKARLETALVDTIIERNPIEDILIETVVKYQLDALAQNLRMPKEEIEQNFGEKAKSDVKASLLLEQIARQENIEVDEDEFDYEIVNRARQLNMDYQKVKERLDQSQDATQELKSEIIVKKTIATLMDQANINDGESEKIEVKEE